MSVVGTGCPQARERGDTDPESGRRETQGEEVMQTLSRGEAGVSVGFGAGAPSQPKGTGAWLSAAGSRLSLGDVAVKGSAAAPA